MKVKVAQSVQLFATPWTIYSSWNSEGKNTGVGSCSLLQGIFPTKDQTQVSHIPGFWIVPIFILQPDSVPSVTTEGLVVLPEGFIQILLGFYLKKKRTDFWPFKFHTVAFICAPAPPSGLHWNWWKVKSHATSETVFIASHNLKRCFCPLLLFKFLSFIQYP